MSQIVVKQVIKRNGSIVAFNLDKIKEAIIKAFKATNEQFDSSSLSSLLLKIQDKIKEDKVNVETIQDVVETELINFNHTVGKAYILYRHEHELLRQERKEGKDGDYHSLVEECMKYFDNDPYRYFIYLRTYSKWLDHLGRRETWVETVDRYMNYMKERLSRINKSLSDEDFKEIREAILKMEVMPSMRLLQFAGSCVDRNDLYAYNCSFGTPRNFSDIRDAMYILMCGTGFGFSVEKVHVDHFPMIETQLSLPEGKDLDKKEKLKVWKEVFGTAKEGVCPLSGDSISILNFTLSPLGEKKEELKPVSYLAAPYTFKPTYIIDDTKEAWCDALLFGLKSWSMGRDVTFDYSRIRKAGTRLKGTGGRASGPGPLIDLLDFVKERMIKRQGMKLRSLDIHDILCKVGQIVEAGNVRRSACLSLSDLNDEEMRKCKSGNFWDTDSQRFLANNSAVYTKKPTDEEFMEEWLSLIKSRSGERGIFNRHSIIKNLPERRTKSLGSKIQFMGANPCLPADTSVMTSHGLKPIKELVGKPFVAVVHGQEYPSTKEGFWSQGKKKIYKVTLDSGLSFKGTANHQFSTEIIEGTRKNKVKRVIWRAIEELKENDSITISNNVGYKWKDGDGTYDEGYFCGQLIGDGTFTKAKDEKGKDVPTVCLWIDPKTDPETQPPYQILTRYAKTLKTRSDFNGFCAVTKTEKYIKYSMRATAFCDLAEKYGIKRLEKKVPESCSYDFARGMLSGLFDSDGTVANDVKKNAYIRLSQNDTGRLEAVQRLLLAMGIVSKIYKNRRAAGPRMMPDGRGGEKLYDCKTFHELSISKEDLIKFRDIIGFNEPAKKEKLESLIKSYKRGPMKTVWTAKVSKIEEVGEEEVFDCTIADASAFSANGLVSANCNEIWLQPSGLCNLTTIVCRPNDTESSLLKKIRLAAILGTYQATLTNINYVSPLYKKNAEEERLLGVSMTGQFDCPAVRNKETLTKLKEEVLKVNEKYANLLGIPISTAVTAVKPEGTVSEMVGSASGMHARFSNYYVRRVRINSSDPLCHMMKDQGVKWSPEVGQTELNHSTAVFEFPIKAPEKAIIRDDVKALDMLEYWCLLKVYYCEHNPSVTVDVGPDEWIDCQQWVMKNWDIVGGISFLPRSDHIYKLAPFEKISKEEYDKKEKVKVDYSKLVYYEKDDTTDRKAEVACAGKDGCNI